MMQASVGFQCPECVKANPAPKTPAGFGGRGGAKPIVTQVLIGINAAMFLITMIGSPNPSGAFGLSGGTDSPLQLQLLLSGSPFREGGVRYTGVAGGEYWRLLTGGFLHGGIFHLAMNMFALWVLGSQLEPMLGRARFVAIYFASLFAGSLGVMILSPTQPTVGASGAIFGLMGAAAVLLRSRGISIWQSSLGQVILLNVGITFFVPGISIGGHLGGLAGGALVALAMSKLESAKPDITKAVAVASAFSVLCIVMSIVLANNWRNPLFG